MVAVARSLFVAGPWADISRRRSGCLPDPKERDPGGIDDARRIPVRKPKTRLWRLTAARVLRLRLWRWGIRAAT